MGPTLTGSAQSEKRSVATDATSGAIGLGCTIASVRASHAPTSAQVTLQMSGRITFTVPPWWVGGAVDGVIEQRAYGP